jgi:hypothetical protein
MMDDQDNKNQSIGVGAPGRLLYDVAAGFMEPEDINMIVMPKFRNERFEETILLAWVAKYGKDLPIKIAPRKMEDAYYQMKEAGQIIYPDIAATKEFPIDLDRFAKQAADPLWINPQGQSYTFKAQNGQQSVAEKHWCRGLSEFI